MPFFTDLRTTRQLAELNAAFDRMPDDALEGIGADREAFVALQEAMHGKIVFEFMPEYEKDRRGNCLYPDLPKPYAIAYCEVESDVAWCLDFCREWKSAFSIRSGGHCTAGYSVSPGMVIDVSLLDDVVVNSVNMTATVGGGISLGKLYTALTPYGLHVPGGECDTVCVGGHMQGGGYGFTSRTFGLNLDHVGWVRVMLADSSIVYADSTTNPDLYWAVRGGSGGNFGVLLQAGYDLATLGDVWAVCVRWSQSDAPQVLNTLQQNYMRNGATSDLGYQLAVARVDGGTCLMFMAMFNGSRADGMQVIQPLLDIGSPITMLDRMGTYQELNSALLSWFTMPPENTMEVKSSQFIARTLSPAEWADIVNYVDTMPNPFNMIAMEIYGGAASAPAWNETAYIHREVDCDLFIDSFCNASWNYNDEAEAKQWLEGFVTLLEQYGNGHRYQNYPDATDTDYRWAYWGNAFPTLLAIKNKYDPTGFFTFPQAITAYPEGEDITRSDADLLIDVDGEIVHEAHAKPGMLTRRR